MVEDALKELLVKPSKYADPVTYFVEVPSEIQKILPYNLYVQTIKSMAIEKKKKKLARNMQSLEAILSEDSKISDEDYIKSHKAYQYAVDVVTGKAITGKYIKKACEQFLKDVDNNDHYFLNVEEIKRVTNMTRLINIATGPREGESVYDALAGFQWFFIINALCWKHKDNPTKRRYEKSVLLISRKNGKSFLIAILFILLMLIEPDYSEFYSVAPDRELSSIVKKELSQTIDKSPFIANHFKLTRDEIRCLLTKSKFTALACSENRLDGRKATAYVADEVGALRNDYPIEAMQSSQMNMINRTGILISTAYESFHNPMINEVEYAEKVLDKTINDETLFALLYKPDNPKDWTEDVALLQANPLAEELPDNLDYLKEQRKKAIEIPSKKKNFMTKHMNIFVDGADAEVFIATEDLVKGRIDHYDWQGKEVFVGVDLAMTTDNTAITMSTYDEDLQKYVAKSWAFYPADRESEKSRIERLNYKFMTEKGYAFACGDSVISYKFVEDFVLSLEEKYGVRIKSIGYDKWQALSSVDRWSEAGYKCIEVRQHSSVLHVATKLLKEEILKGNFLYEANPLLEINFSNAREVYDTNLNTYVNKKKSTGKIDMVAALINTMYLHDVEMAKKRRPRKKARTIG
ncbi:terminase large subunit [Kurthia massiliensis]|uniref:terminase large subunit n=1 Tax=Kurthia massiliensis TaxID=1033739 RepID=UPI000289EB20|nr:terminase TerL endonuclease subunit [Kurthia massiliensis]